MGDAAYQRAKEIFASCNADGITTAEESKVKAGKS